jgi:hypothetical protein
MKDGNGRQGDFSEVATFTKQYPVSTLISPINGETITTTPTFVWTPVDGAAHYKLEISLVPNFATAYESITTDNTRYTPQKKYDINKTYYWRVAIQDDDGNIGPFNNATIILQPYDYIFYLPLIRK